MQNNADKVEKDILRAEELLALVWAHATHKLKHTHIEHQYNDLKSNRFPQEDKNEKQELPFQHQNEISDKLGEAEGLIKDLFLDVDKAKKLNHPQAKDIEKEWVVPERIQHIQNLLEPIKL